MIWLPNWRVAAVEVIVLSPGFDIMLCPRLELRAVLRACVLATVLGILSPACDAGPHPPDAQTAVSTRTAELSVRFDVGADSTATVSVLGFRATTAGPDEPDALGIVDPRSAAAPDQGCQLRDADEASSALTARGSSIDLEELSGVGVGLAPTDPLLRPFPRLYPDVAGVVGGVVAEAGPQALATLPDHLSVYSADSELPIADLGIPSPPKLLAINGAAPVAGARIDGSSGLSLSLGSGAGALVELRPFGATVSVACSVPANASTDAIVVVPRALLAHLGHALSIEVARRSQTRDPLLVGGTRTRVSVEVRSALAVELRP
jgi:hypothetical protein